MRAALALGVVVALATTIAWLAAPGAAPAIPETTGTPQLAPRPGALEEPATRAQGRATHAARPAPASARLALHLVDAATGESLPHYAIDVPGERLVTDALGRCASARALPLGLVELRLLDHPDLPRDGAHAMAHKHTSGALATIEVPAGPTYTLLTRLPEGRAEDAFELGLLDLHTLSISAILPAPNTPLRSTGGKHWCRFRASSGAEWTEEWTLTLGSKDGTWSGSAHVDAAVGIYPQRVSIDLQARGRLVVRPVNLIGQAVPEVWVRLEGPGEWTYGRPAYASPPPGSPLSPAGTLTSPWLPTGVYSLAVSSPAHERQVRTVTLAPGTNLIEARLVTLPPGGDVAGSLHSAKGVTIGGVSMRLVTEFPEHRELLGMIGWDLDQGFGRFRFPDMPEGTYRVEVICQGFHAWDPPSITVTAPRDDLVFTRQDDVESFTAQLRVVDARTRAQLDEVRVSLRNETGANLSISKCAPDMPLPPMPAGARVKWRIERVGYRAAEGFDLENDCRKAPAGGYLLQVALQRE
ncbi:MAG: carboxypeptidase regulatory-like domain-containing protein [bacterium]|nr:carboxypeptidase regulatory-like domain-containing protein [bacterium]